jgi:hypothetical protein
LPDIDVLSTSWCAGRFDATLREVYETVEDLTGAVTGVLGPLGPTASLTQNLTNSLDGVWADFFNAPIPPGGTNWNAYTHQQLYDMLWQGADVGDVSTVAAEWGRHGSALTEYADALRSQAAELRSNWQGRAADLAGDRLAELSDRVWSVGARASTVQKATADAGDALAVARNTMPPPPPDPMTLLTSAVGAGPMPPLEAVAVGGARLFTADAVAGVAKAEAVRVMQRYEASLHNSSHRVVPSGAPEPRTQRTSAAAIAGGAPTGGGVPWARLVGGSAGGIASGPVQGVLAAERATLSELAAMRAMGAGVYPPAVLAQAQDEEDKVHHSRLPNVHHGFFAPDGRASAPVIGDLTDREKGIGR